MSEERLLRLTKDQFHRISIRFQHENSFKNGNHEMMVAVGMPKELGKKFEELKLAASGHWRPFCHTPHMGECIGSLVIEHVLNGVDYNDKKFELPETCKECPYLKEA